MLLCSECQRQLAPDRFSWTQRRNVERRCKECVGSSILPPAKTALGDAKTHMLLDEEQEDADLEIIIQAASELRKNHAHRLSGSAAC